MPYAYKPNVVSNRVMSDVEAAYIAGLIDGEGTISLRARVHNRKRSHCFFPIVCMSSTTECLIDAVLRMTGNGGVQKVDGGGKVRTQYKWSLSPNQIRHVLPQIVPYLVEKRRRAILLIEYLELVEGTGGGVRGTKDEDIPKVAAIYAELATLNQRGDSKAKEIEITTRDPMPREIQPCTINGCKQRQYQQSGWCHQHWLERREPIIKQCEFCGNDFDAVIAHKRFCNAKCQWRAYAAKRKH